MGRIRVLVADDSALMRQTLKRIIAASADLDLVGLARDGEDAVAKARELRPDVVSMDINMPKLDGISALQIILQEKICPVVMVSSLTQQGTATTFECLELGAFDFVGKPDGTVSNNMGVVAEELISKLKAAASRGIIDRLQRNRERRQPYRPPVRAHFREHCPKEGCSHRNFHRRPGDTAGGAAADSGQRARQHFPGAAYAARLYRIFRQTVGRSLRAQGGGRRARACPWSRACATSRPAECTCASTAK